MTGRRGTRTRPTIVLAPEPPEDRRSGPSVGSAMFAVTAGIDDRQASRARANGLRPLRPERASCEAQLVPLLRAMVSPPDESPSSLWFRRIWEPQGETPNALCLIRHRERSCQRAEAAPV